MEPRRSYKPLKASSFQSQLTRAGGWAPPCCYLAEKAGVGSVAWERGGSHKRPWRENSGLRGFLRGGIQALMGLEAGQISSRSETDSGTWTGAPHSPAFSVERPGDLASASADPAAADNATPGRHRAIPVFCNVTPDGRKATAVFVALRCSAVRLSRPAITLRRAG